MTDWQRDPTGTETEQNSKHLCSCVMYAVCRCMLMLYRLGAAYVLSERLASQHLFATKFVMMSRSIGRHCLIFCPSQLQMASRQRGMRWYFSPSHGCCVNTKFCPVFAPCHRPSFPGPEADLAMACCGWFRLKGSETIEIQILPAWLAIEATYKTRLYYTIEYCR